MYEPWKCVRFVKSNSICKGHPDFSEWALDKEFAVAVLEDKPVFVGDELYHNETGKKYVMDDDNIARHSEVDGISCHAISRYATWKKPKMLHGKVIRVGNIIFRKIDGKAFTVREVTEGNVRLTKVEDGGRMIDSTLPEEHYAWNLSECAIGELEGVPVYPGATIYRRGKPLEVLGHVDDNFTEDKYFRVKNTNGDTAIWLKSRLNQCSWKPPKPKKRTFLLNGVELPCPVKQPKIMWCSITINNREFHFENGSDALKVKDALVDLMREARGR